MLSPEFTGPPAGLLLSDVLPQARPIGAGDICFKACSTHAASVRPGDLFIAVDGDDRDGHHDVMQAIQRGAMGVVTERFLPIQAPQFLVEDTRSALALIGHALAGYPSRRTQLVAVLDGVHTVTPTVMMSAVLERSGFLTGLANEFGACDGVRTNTQTTPISSPLTFARWLAECHANQASHTVVGMTPATVVNHALDGTQLSHLVLTGLRPDRGVGHARPGAAAQRLLRQVDPQGILIYNRDDLLCREMAAASSVPGLSYGLSGDADIRGEIVERHRGQQTLLIEGLGDFAAVQSRPFGYRFASFCLAATALGLSLGIEFSEIGVALEQVERLPLCLEPVCGGQPFGIYLDHAGDPWSVRQCLKSLRGTFAGRLICVVTAGSALSQEERAILGRTVEVGAEVNILTADPQDEPASRLPAVHGVLDGFQNAQSPLVCADRARGVRRALEMAGPDDVVLVTGCRGDIGGATTRRCDRQVIEQWLQRELNQRTASIPSSS